MYYARQVSPDAQESPIWETNEYDKLFVKGNDFHKSHNEKSTAGQLYAQAVKYASDILKTMEKYRIQRYDARDIAGIVQETMPPRMDGSIYTASEILAIASYMRCIDSVYTVYPDDYARIMSLMNPGHRYIMMPIVNPKLPRVDVIETYYDTNDYNNDSIKTKFKAEFFNTGTQWMVCDAELSAIPDDIDGMTDVKEHSVYCSASADYPQVLQAEIADAIGTTPGNIILFKFERYGKTPIYRRSQI